MSLKEWLFGTGVQTSGASSAYRDSIQAWLPIKNIIGGVVITKDNRFIKILEVLPVNFYLKSGNDQQNIIAAYASYLKIAPDTMTCEVRTLPDLTEPYSNKNRRIHCPRTAKPVPQKPRNLRFWNRRNRGQVILKFVILIPVILKSVTL